MGVLVGGVHVHIVQWEVKAGRRVGSMGRGEVKVGWLENGGMRT